VIVESGHYALVLALALALIQSTVPLLGARLHDPALMNVARSTALAQLLFVALSFLALVTLHVTSDFFRRQCVRELAFAETADLQGHRRMGQSRGLHAAMGVDPGAVRRPGRSLWRQPAAFRCAPTCWRCRPGSPAPSICSS